MELNLPPPQPLSNPFMGVNWHVVAYAAFMATLISVLMISRRRNEQASRGLPLPPWHRVLPDVALGTIFGTLAALGIPPFFPWLNTLSGLALLAGLGGLAGPKLLDKVLHWIEDQGWQTLLEYIATKAAGPLAAIASAAAEKEAAARAPKGGETYDETPPPAEQAPGTADEPGPVGPPDQYR